MASDRRQAIATGSTRIRQIGITCIHRFAAL